MCVLEQAELDAALQKAKETDRTVAVDFGAEWCNYCVESIDLSSVSEPIGNREHRLLKGVDSKLSSV